MSKKIIDIADKYVIINSDAMYVLQWYWKNIPANN